ncbi:MAG: hypothetical protein H6558_08160 [Lewinellaceae bacterium]|nr:hypothetical protein [Lewinellaceae bacterium]
MFKLALPKMIAAIAAIALMSFTAAPSESGPASMLTLRAGTPISLTLNQTVSSRDVQIGNIVEFMVRSNVTVNGQVVIAAGSIAEGMVTNVVNPCRDNDCRAKCAKLEIVVETVQAVDGQRVFLRSIPLTVKGECCGRCDEPAVANMGAVMSARVQNDITINA